MMNGQGMVRLRHRPEFLTLIDDLLEEAGAAPMHKQTRRKRNRIERRAEALLRLGSHEGLFTSAHDEGDKWPPSSF
jgi:hypothetical protein